MPPTTVSVAGGATLAVQLGNGTTGWSNTQIGSLLGNVSWSNSTAAFGIDTTNGSSTYTGNLTQALGLTKLGANNLTLTGSNTYTGLTTVAVGGLVAASTVSLPNWNTPGFVNVAAGAVLAVQTSGGATAGWSVPQINTLLGTVNWAGNALLGIDTTNGNCTYNGNITTQPIGLAKLGQNTLFLTGTNSYPGGTQINAGTLDIAADTAMGAPSGPLTFTGSGTLQAGANVIDLNSARSITINSGAAATFDTQTYNMEIDSTITGPGSLNTVGSGTLTLTAANSFTGGTSLTAGVLSVATLNDHASSNLGSAGTLTVSGGTLLYTGTGDTTKRSVTMSDPGGTIQVLNPGVNLTFAGGVSGPNNLALTKTGSGTLTLAGQGDNGGLYASVVQGTLVLGKTNSQNGHAVSSITNVSPGALLQMGSNGSGGAQIYANLLSMNGTFDLNGMNEGLIGLTGTGTVTNSAGSTTSLLTFGYVPGGAIGGSNTFPGVISDGNGLMALAVSSGVVNNALANVDLILTATNNAYSGGTTISAGTLQIGDGLTSPGSLPGNVAISTLAYTTSAGNFTANGALIIDTPFGMSIAAGGNISGSSSSGLTKSGVGILTLSGSNSFAGATTVNSGTLAYASIAAVSSNSSILINSPAEVSVGGTYTIMGLLNGTLINPASTGLLALAGSSNENIKMAGYNSLWLGAVAGGATLSGSLTPANTGYLLGGGAAS